MRCAASDDGTLLLGSGDDGTASLYDLTSRTRIGDPIRVAASGAVPVDLAGSGAVAAFSGRDLDTAVLWDLEPSSWERAACRLAGRNLTRHEWSTYLGSLGPYRATCPEFPAT